MVIGYVFTVLNYIFYCSSRFCEKKYQILFLDLLAKISTIISLYFLGSLSGAYSMFVSACVLVVANIKEYYHHRWPVLYVIFQTVLITILVLKFAGLSSILVFCTSTVSLFSIWWLKPQHMRIAGFLSSITYLCYQMSISNWAGLLEIVVLWSNCISYIKYAKKEKVKMH